jgi:hypothetical protein
MGKAMGYGSRAFVHSNPIWTKRTDQVHLIYESYMSVYLSCRAGCNFLLLSLVAKGKQNTARSLCNFLLLSLAAKGKKNTARSLCNFLSCPWQQKENSKQGRAGAG